MNNQVTIISEPRLPYHPFLANPEFGIDKATWRLVVESVYPNAKTVEGVLLALRYCKNRGLDILKRPVHVVPVYSSRLKKEVELVWPGIAEYRTTAARTGVYGGCDETELGPLRKEKFSAEWFDSYKNQNKHAEAELEYYEWMRVTVYRIVGGARCPFPGPKVYFKEIYSRLNYNADVPNERWQKSPHGQLEKCAEAAALRKAFPEEIGGDYTSDEMEGKVMDVGTIDLPPVPKKHAEEVAKSTAGEAVEAETITEVEAMPDDWTDLRDELINNINSCKQMTDIDYILSMREKDIIELQDHAPKSISIAFAEAVSKKRHAIKSGAEK